jgi:hypothetical protein
MTSKSSKVWKCEVKTKKGKTVLRVMPTLQGEWQITPDSGASSWGTPKTQVHRFPSASAAMAAYDASWGPQKWRSN